MVITIRPARQEDQQTILSFIRQAKINPRNLHWERFLVAEENGQVKIHEQGTREVASGFVLPEFRRQGVSARLMNELMARERGPLYTMIDQKWTPYYEQFGFKRVEVDQLPTSLISIFRKDKIHIIPMKRE